MGKRFVMHFYTFFGEPSVEEQINNCAKERDLKIITIAPLYQSGIYVLFEKGGEE